MGNELGEVCPKFYYMVACCLYLGDGKLHVENDRAMIRKISYRQPSIVHKLAHFLLPCSSMLRKMADFE